MQVSAVGTSVSYDLMEKGTLFVANDGDFKTYFIKIGASHLSGVVCFKTKGEYGYAGKPGFYDTGLYSGESYFVPSDVYFKIDTDSLLVDKKYANVGDALLVGDQVCLCAQLSNTKMIVNLSSGTVVNLENGVPRAIFEKWSLVRKVGDVETTLLEYPGA